MQKEISTPEKKVLDFIHTFKNSHDYSPSMREISDGTGVRSPSQVASLSKGLKALGLVDYVPRVARTIHLTDAGKEIYKLKNIRRAAVKVHGKLFPPWLDNNLVTSVET